MRNEVADIDTDRCGDDVVGVATGLDGIVKYLFGDGQGGIHETFEEGLGVVFAVEDLLHLLRAEHALCIAGHIDIAEAMFEYHRFKAPLGDYGDGVTGLLQAPSECDHGLDISARTNGKNRDLHYPLKIKSAR